MTLYIKKDDYKTENLKMYGQSKILCLDVEQWGENIGFGRRTFS